MEDFNLTYWEEEQEKNRTRGMVVSFVVHLILLLLLLLPLINRTESPLDFQEGILVSFGNPDQGSGNDLPEVQAIEPIVEATESPATKSVESEVQSQSESSVPPPSNPQPTPQDQDLASAQFEKVVTTEVDPIFQVTESEKIIEDNNKAAEQQRKQAEAEALQEQQQEAEMAQASEEARREEEAKKLAEAEAKRIAEAEEAKKAADEASRKAAEEAARKEAELAEKKAQFGDFLGGEGKGENNTSGNQGDPAGDPNADILTGISKGAGSVGEGLGDRGVLSTPTIQEHSQKTGTVVVRVCIDPSGNVLTARFTQNGSTTTDSELVEAALEGAKKYKFTQAEIEEQCGNVSIDFRVR